MNFLNLLARITVPREQIGYNPTITGAEYGLHSILELVYFWAGVVAVVVLVVASFLFVTSRGDPAQMKRSKDAIRGAVIGLVVIMAAFAITRFVLGGLQ